MINSVAKKYFIALVLFLVFNFLPGRNSYIRGQSLGVDYQIGRVIANHPRFPRLNSPAQAIELSYTIEPQETKLWSLLHGYPRLSWVASFQTLGNKKVLGQAYGVAPVLGFYLWRSVHWRLQMQLGWGLAYLSRHYDDFDNRENIVIGTAINAYNTAALRLAYRWSAWEPSLSLAVGHYSNGHLRAPNLGANIVSLRLGIAYHCLSHSQAGKKERKEALSRLEAFQGRWSAGLRLGLGANSYQSRGPLYPAYLLALGLGYQYARQGLVSAGVEYSINTASYHFRRHNNASATQIRDFDRYSIWIDHELLFGHIGFYTLGGIYLNKHSEQRSLFATQVGLNFYPRSVFRSLQHQCWIGLHIRAYFGLAEFPMLQLGYRF